jgi:hypothetical protein
LKKMKRALEISIGMNVVLLGGWFLLLAERGAERVVPVPARVATAPSELAESGPAMPGPKMAPEPFRWRQIESRTNYRVYIANLRAIGCPEPTLEDIVRGDADRAFAFERNQLNLDASGSGPWSQHREAQLVAMLLEEPSANSSSAQNMTGQTMPGQATAQATGGGNQMQQMNTGAGNPAQDTGVTHTYPLFLQNVNWSALGFNADQQAAMAQVRQQFQNELAGLNQNADNASTQNSGETTPNATAANSDPAGSTPSAQFQTALQDADAQLRDLLGPQAYAAYEQQQYYAWFQPQVAANAGGGTLFINPDAFPLK